jgi:site-specific DNA-cytosine methylase
LPVFDILKTKLVNGGTWFEGDEYNLFIDIKDVHGILCAPPCTHFSVSGAQYWKQKDNNGKTEK